MSSPMFELSDSSCTECGALLEFDRHILSREGGTEVDIDIYNCLGCEKEFYVWIEDGYELHVSLTLEDKFDDKLGD